MPRIRDQIGQLEKRLLEIQDAYLTDPTRPIIVSYPRCGRHWLLFSLECYYGLSISFKETPWSNNEDVSKVLHLHNLNALPQEVGYNFVYGYRKDPVAVCYSNVELSIHRLFYIHHTGRFSQEEFIKDKTEVAADTYGQNLQDHLVDQKFSAPKEIYTYEDMCDNLEGVIRKIVAFLGDPFESDRFARVQREVTKEKVRDLCVEGGMDTREEGRQLYTETYGDRIWELVTAGRPAVERLLQ